MKKTILLVAVMLLTLQFCHAQKLTTQKSIIGIGTFSGPNQEYADLLRSRAFEDMPSCRVNTVDYNQMKAQGDEAMVDYILDVTLGTMTFSQVDATLSKGKAWRAKTSYQLTLSDAYTGDVVSKGQGEGSWTAAEKEDAAKGALRVAQSEYRDLINEGVKTIVKVVEVVETNKKGDKAEVIKIQGGSTIGVCNLLWFNVDCEYTSSNNTSFKTIGSANVKEVIDGDTALLKIRKGGKDIMKAMKEGKIVIVRSRKPNLLESALDLGQEVIGGKEG